MHLTEARKAPVSTPEQPADRQKAAHIRLARAVFDASPRLHERRSVPGSIARARGVWGRRVRSGQKVAVVISQTAVVEMIRRVSIATGRSIEDVTREALRLVVKP